MTAAEAAEVHRQVVALQAGEASRDANPYRARGYHDAAELVRGVEGGIVGVR